MQRIRLLNITQTTTKHQSSFKINIIAYDNQLNILSYSYAIAHNFTLLCLCACICWLCAYDSILELLQISVLMLLRKLFCCLLCLKLSILCLILSCCTLFTRYCLSDHVISIYGFGVFAIFSNILLNHLKKIQPSLKKLTCVSKYAPYFVFRKFIGLQSKIVCHFVGKFSLQNSFIL